MIPMFQPPYLSSSWSAITLNDVARNPLRVTKTSLYSTVKYQLLDGLHHTWIWWAPEDES